MKKTFLTGTAKEDIKAGDSFDIVVDLKTGEIEIKLFKPQEEK